MNRGHIELTSKKWKFRRLLGLLLFCLGWPALILAGAMIGDQRPVPVAGQAFVFVAFGMIGGGFLLYAWARFMSWWHHG